MKDSPIYGIIVAGGSGKRMNNTLPKQFIPIGGLPVLMHTIKRFIDYPKSINIVLVLPKDQITTWENLCRTYSFASSYPSFSIVEGGETRFQSVKNGLQSIAEKEGIVLIHDGVRPFVSRKIIENAIKTTIQWGNAISSVPLKESIRAIEGDKNKSAERTAFRIIQTPQCFRLSFIKEAYEAPELPLFTDDASVAEYAGASIKLIEGAYENIKITTPEDLKLAEIMANTFKD
jgi:2-C-methyl-D-erythritol 4-phosphate cytidylyltransferase